MTNRHYHQAFGLTWSSDIPLGDFAVASPPDSLEQSDITVTQTRSPLPQRRGLTAINRGGVCDDGIRFCWNEEVSFDVYDGERVEWRAGTDWQGGMPQPFFSTLTALLVAWRKQIPIHGSAVELDGNAYLIVGPSGAGKSTLAAALIARGARLISDDLSALEVSDDRTTATLATGRPAIRLYPQIVKYCQDSTPMEKVPETREHKQLIWPAMPPQSNRYPLAGVIYRDPDIALEAPEQCGEALQMQLFRKKWMSVLPHRRFRNDSLFTIGCNIPAISVQDRPIDEQKAFHSLSDSVLKSLEITNEKR